MKSDLHAEKLTTFAVHSDCENMETWVFLWQGVFPVEQGFNINPQDESCWLLFWWQKSPCPHSLVTAAGINDVSGLCGYGSYCGGELKT